MSGLEVATIMKAASAAFTLVGAVQGAAAQRDAGEFHEAVGKQQAQLAERDAGQQRAASQREAIEQRRQGRLVSSRAQALAAASGSGALDPTITNILGDIDTEAELRAQTALFEGEDLARKIEYEGQIARAGGTARREFARRKATNTLLAGGASLFDLYAPKKKKKDKDGGSGFETKSPFGGRSYGFGGKTYG